MRGGLGRRFLVEAAFIVLVAFAAAALGLSRPAIVVPEPEPEPGSVAAEPAPEPEPVVAEPEPPRSWSLWELERLVRASSGADSVHDGELTFLLVHLRDFASPDGVLPVDFDGLVRESFGYLFATPTGA